MGNVRGYQSNRGGKITNVKSHSRGKYRSVRSSFIDRVSEAEGGGMVVTILGRDYPYPLAGKGQVSGLVNAMSTGRYYNKQIRGKYF